ncbi:MAG TPA: hypothetical protein VGR60_00090 [Gemmatimonadales bacterium]|nr:hypothetical protein [Gemmatimonadales bacterium]
MTLRRAVLFAFLIAGGARPARAQLTEFGQNKVQYRTLDWHVMHGAHVDLYFYPAEAALAPTALAWAEESYDTLARKFDHEVAARIPLLVYATHADFEQTNVLPFAPPEGVLGVTDYLKRRVTLPFRGNYAEFRGTLRHEMTHVFQLDLEGDAYARTFHDASSFLPLWWSEGLAEYFSAGQDARDEMIMRDLTISGRLPSLHDLGYVEGAIVYPIGGRIHQWLGRTYGDWRIAKFYHDLWRYDDFEDAIYGTYGRTLAQLSAEFQEAMRRAYYPAIAERRALDASAVRIAAGAVKPVLTAGGDTAVYFSAPRGYVVAQARSLDGGPARTLVTAGRSADIESFHPFESRIDASRPGYLLFSTRHEDRDALVVWDIVRQQVVGRYQFPDLVSIMSPAWLPGDSAVVFSGLASSGVSDLYRFTFDGQRLEHLTDDRYQDLDPSPSPDGTRIVFASDRTAGGLDGAVNLFVLDLATHAVRQLTAGPWVDEAPHWAPNGRIYFASSRDSVLNTFSVDTAGNGRRETSAWTGTYDPTWVPGRDAMLVGGFHDLTFGVYLVPPDTIARRDTFSLVAAAPAGRWAWPAPPGAAAEVTAARPYRSRYTLDFALAEAEFIPGVATVQGATALFSDLLGDHVVIANFATYQGPTLGSLFDNLNVSALYLDQSRRLNWGVGAFRAKGDVYESGYTVDYAETATGAFGFVRYPLSPFSRVDGTFVLAQSDRFDFTLPVTDLHRVGFIASQYLSYVFDNSAWLPTGPIDGTRFAITGGISSDLTNSRFDNWVLGADLRQYIRLSRQSAYAVRAFGFESGGDRPRRINIGGTLGLRGYPNYGYIVGTHAVMLNQELRFPIFDFLGLGIPVQEIRLPGVQGAIFADVGKAWYDQTAATSTIGSYGLSFRMALTPVAVLRLDWGDRWTTGNYDGYGLGLAGKRFVSFFFGYNY